jgi:hypothetical protein
MGELRERESHPLAGGDTEDGGDTRRRGAGMAKRRKRKRVKRGMEIGLRQTALTDSSHESSRTAGNARSEGFFKAFRHLAIQGR